MDKNKIDLDSPAFSPTELSSSSEQSGDGMPIVDKDSVSLDSQPKTAVEKEEKTEASSSAEKDVVEQKVPFSRFQTALDRAKTAEARARFADELEERLARIEQQSTFRSEKTGELPRSWVELYGDSDKSKDIYKAEQQRQREWFEQAKDELLQTFQGQEREEAKRRQLIESTIDDNLDSLESSLGKVLSDDEKADILDVVDQYTPQDEDGNFLGEPIDLDKAYEIYELKKAQANTSKRRARRAVSSLTSTSSEGDASVGTQTSDEPPRWGNWRKKI